MDFRKASGFHKVQQGHFATDHVGPSGVLKVMYIFAGHRRKADVHEHLLTLADSFGFTLEMHEFDLLRDEKQNLLDEDFWTQLQKLVLEIRPFCVIATPPCSTYSRARNHYDKKPGPRPIRSKEHPRGFPWLSQKDRIKADEGTLLAERTWELFALASSVDAFYLGEFPEDLGATNNGIPASIWQMQQFQDVLVWPGSKTFALFQCEFGASTPKPTRLVTDLDGWEGNIYMGVPQFDSAWHYKGPLPPRCSHGGDHPQLIGTDEQGQWRTAPAAHYPGALCLFIARAIAQTWAKSSSASRGKSSADEFRRGCGALQSPTLQMSDLRERWFALLPDGGRASEVPEGQPFRLHALAQSLRLMGDPDVDILDKTPGSNFVDGVHVGHLEPLGPTPQVYRPRLKEPSYDESEWSQEVGNYFRGDEAAAEKILEEQFREEERAGRMTPLSEKEAAKRYPGRSLRVAAQGMVIASSMTAHMV